jgi:conjugal transfer pilus assembly protein TraV
MIAEGLKNQKRRRIKMRQTISYGLIAALMMLWLNACAVLNPYDSEFMCPDGFAGECASVKKAYEKSFNSDDESFSPMVKNKKKPDSEGKKDKSYDERYRYEQALYKEMAGLIEQPATPVLIPSKQLRVLIPGYVDEKQGVYYGHRYAFFTARKASWALRPFDSAEDMEGGE